MTAVDPLAAFRKPPEPRKPKVFAVGTKREVRAWAADQRMKETPTLIATYADTEGLRFQDDDVLVYVDGWDRLVEADLIWHMLEAAAKCSFVPHLIGAPE